MTGEHLSSNSLTLAKLNCPSFSEVFWVDASSSGTIIQALKGICQFVDWMALLSLLSGGLAL